MTKHLVIVESPAKIKTLKKILGENYELEASVGHICDLPQKGLGIDIDNDFTPTYTTLPEKEKVVNVLIKAAKKADVVYLALDPDREGEAIAWHIANLLPKNIPIKRARFNAITREAVLNGLNQAGEINQALVNAQQARRLLDRLVGYKISPLLSRRVQRSTGGPLSAGRVQSVALMLVVQREAAIDAFKPIEYWTIEALLSGSEKGRIFTAFVHSVDGKRVEKEAVEGKEVYLIATQETAHQIKSRLERAKFKVQEIQRKEKRRNPVPPFITSTLQQEASRHYSFSSSRTMGIAQTLYEGVDLGGGEREGLITYMRTDSVRIDPEALQEVRKTIASTFGQEYLPAQPRLYSTKQSAQDAHEAIRPTHSYRHPDQVRSYLTDEQFKLYTLIWRRFVASQMESAVYDTVTIDITTDQAIELRSTGSILKFPGFLAIYEERRDDDKKEDEDLLLPNLQLQELLTSHEVNASQSFTRPPPRFSEALLVKELEKSGIGRPSTYAAIMNKIQGRDYTVKDSNRLKPTELGKIISTLLQENFSQIMDVNFTAKMEDELELVGENQLEWKQLLKDFWSNFYPTVLAAEESFRVPKVDTDKICPKCNKHLQKIWAGTKYFYGCSGYPECDYRVSVEEFDFNRDAYNPNFDWNQSCPLCKGAMQLRHGKYGPFLGCSGYPNCRGIINVTKEGEAESPGPAGTPVNCPCPALNCPGQLLAKRSRFGKTFYSCSTFPACDVIGNTVEAIQEKYANYERSPYTKPPKKKTVKETKTSRTKSAQGVEKKSAKGGFSTQLLPLPALFHPVAGDQPISRTDLTKKIWEYIRAHNLQDPKDKRMILPDAALGKIFGGNESISMFQMAGKISAALKTTNNDTSSES
jgi:DNA topoisomerase-1